MPYINGSRSPAHAVSPGLLSVSCSEEMWLKRKELRACKELDALSRDVMNKFGPEAGDSQHWGSMEFPFSTQQLLLPWFPLASRKYELDLTRYFLLDLHDYRTV